jgi:uncharacterized membrane protein YkvA (DUF1232 family)
MAKAGIPGPLAKTRTVGKLWRYLRDPGVATWRKLAGVAAVGYVLWPLDLIPDGIPVLGWLDDAGILAAAAAFLVAEVRRHERKQQQAPDSL